MSKVCDTRSSNSGSFSSTDLKFGSFIAKNLKFKTVLAIFEILKTFQVYITIKHRAAFDYKSALSGFWL